MDIFERPLDEELKLEVIVPMFDYLYKMKGNSKEVYNYLLLKDANEAPIITPAQDERIQRAKNYIKLNYTRSISLATVSSVACVSKYHFCKIFKNKEGASFKEYVTGLRIKKAAELLMNSNISVAEVAYNVGFSSQSHFTALFRSWIKITPGEFRKKSF
jgi:AraC-like DNA-binding protein